MDGYILDAKNIIFNSNVESSISRISRSQINISLLPKCREIRRLFYRFLDTGYHEDEAANMNREGHSPIIYCSLECGLGALKAVPPPTEESAAAIEMRIRFAHNATAYNL